MGGGVAGDGALLAIAASPTRPSPPYRMLVATGASVTLLAGPPPVGTPATEKAGFDLLDAPGAIADPIDDDAAAVRGQFRGVSVLRLPLQPVGETTCATRPSPASPAACWAATSCAAIPSRCGSARPARPQPAVCSSMTLWPHLGPDLGFLQDSGYAVIRFALAGGGEVTAEGDPDFLGQRGPLVVEPSRIVMRTCAAPKEFLPAPMPTTAVTCCKETDAEAPGVKTGIDLAMVLDTGVGPMVLSQSAWARVKATLPAPGRRRRTRTDVPSGDVCWIATWPVPLPTIAWSTIPRYALVDLETGPATDPGPCVELARARRLEQVSYQIVQDAMNQVQTMACTQPCDADPREPDKAQNSAAYLELTGQIPVAIIPDDRPTCRACASICARRSPRSTALIGAGALGRARLEIDYVSSPSRAVFSCESGRAPRRVLRGRPLPPAARRRLPAPLLRAPAARARARVRVGMLTATPAQARRPQAGRSSGAPARALPRPVTMAAMRLYAAAALGLIALTTTTAHAATTRIRVAIPEFQLEGSPPPALGIQLQDGFVLGWVRAGAHVLDPADTAKKLEGHPELQRCDASPCLKAIGQALDVNYIVRVKVEVAGNSYKSVARLFTTEGAAPAALPIATESKSCDVCTVAEARAVMLRIADGLRAHIEDNTPPTPPPPAAPAPQPPRLVGPVLLAMAGAVAIGAGFAVLATNGSCMATGCDENRTRSAIGGVLIGVGAAVTIGGTYITIVVAAAATR